MTAVAAVTAALVPGAAAAAPASGVPDLSALTAVDATPYRSLSYANGGRHFFRAGSTLCQIGSGASSAACRIRPATAPPNAIGVTLSGENAGPYWVRRDSSFQLGPVSRFRAPALTPGHRITVRNTTCGVPKAGVIICHNNNRSFTVSRSWHRFTYPKGDRYHDRNPHPRYLPKDIRSPQLR